MSLGHWFSDAPQFIVIWSETS